MLKQHPRILVREGTPKIQLNHIHHTKIKSQNPVVCDELPFSQKNVGKADRSDILHAKKMIPCSSFHVITPYH